MKRGQTIQEKEKRQLLAELVWFERGGERISLPELMEEAGVSPSIYDRWHEGGSMSRSSFSKIRKNLRLKHQSFGEWIVNFSGRQSGGPLRDLTEIEEEDPSAWYWMLDALCCAFYFALRISDPELVLSLCHSPSNRARPAAVKAFVSEETSLWIVFRESDDKVLVEIQRSSIGRPSELLASGYVSVDNATILDAALDLLRSECGMDASDQADA